MSVADQGRAPARMRVVTPGFGGRLAHAGLGLAGLALLLALWWAATDLLAAEGSFARRFSPGDALPALAALLSDACDAGTARRLAALLEGDADVARRVQELAARETARVAGAVPRQVGTHVSIRSQGAKVFIDVDVEAAFT